jgi:hypothetical protein
MFLFRSDCYYCNMLEGIKRKFLAQCYNCFPLKSIIVVIRILSCHVCFHTLCNGRCLIDALFLVRVHNVFKSCFSLYETVGIRVPTRHFRDFPLFAVGFSRKTCLSATCVSAANTVCIDTNIFSKNLITLKHIVKKTTFWC